MMEPKKLQNVVVISLWVAAIAVVTLLLLARVERSGAQGYLALGICALMWTISLVRMLAWNNRGAVTEKREKLWLVIALLGPTLVVLLALVFNCVTRGQYVGAGLALLVMSMLIQAAREILKRHQKPNAQAKRSKG